MHLLPEKPSFISVIAAYSGGEAVRGNVFPPTPLKPEFLPFASQSKCSTALFGQKNNQESLLLSTHFLFSVVVTILLSFSPSLRNLSGIQKEKQLYSCTLLKICITKECYTRSNQKQSGDDY